MLAIFGERKGTMDQRAIHLEQTTEYVTRMSWHVQNHLLEDQQRLLAVDHQVADAALMILNDEDVLGKVFTHNHEVDLMHIALNGLKICHPPPLQAAMITSCGTHCVPPDVLRLLPVHQGAQYVSPRGYNCTIVPENAVACRHALDDYASHTSCCPGKRMA